MKKHTLFAGLILGAAVLVATAFLPIQMTGAQGGGIPIGYGGGVTGTIAASMPQALYTFNGMQDDLVHVDVIPLGGDFTPTVQLTAPDGQVLASSQHNRLIVHDRSAQIARVLPLTGPYIITVAGQNGTTGDFALRLHGRMMVNRTELAYGVPVDVTIPVNPAAQFYTFTAQDCPTTLTVTNGATGLPYTFPFVVKVRNDRGEDIAQLVGGDAQQDRVTVAALSGQYEVEVLSDDPAVAGMITLLVTCASGAPNCGAAGAASGAPTASCPPCASCPGDFENGTIPVCPVMDLRVGPGPDGGTLLTWEAVPFAEYYWLHIYGYREDEEVYLGAASSPGHVTEFLFDHLFDGFWGFRFVIEAMVGEDAVCSDETRIWMAQQAPVCGDFTVTGRVDSDIERTVTWTWDAYPGAETYFGEMFFIEPDGTETQVGASWYEADTTTVTTFHALTLAPSDVWRLRVHVMVEGDLVCVAEDTITFERLPPEQIVEPECENFTFAVTSWEGSIAHLAWSHYPGAEGYWFYILDSAGMMLPGYPTLFPPGQLTADVDLPPGEYAAGLGPWVTPDGVICLQGLNLRVRDEFLVAPCEISTANSDVWVHVGPGRERAVFAFLNAGQRYQVLGTAQDSVGNQWWQIDKTLFPGHEAVISLWVAASDVDEFGDCDQVPPEEPPPLIPQEPQPGGQWLPCGSCDTCGHPGECVTSPAGECLWDPTTCRQEQPPPPEEGGGEQPGQEPPPTEPPQPQCVTVIGQVDPPGTGSAGAITAGNCISEIAGIYTPGTVAQVQAFPNPGCELTYWSGCGVNEGINPPNPVSITVNSSCTITAHITCVY